MSIYKNKKIIVLFLAPVTIGLLVFVYYPLIQTIIGSLYKWVSYSPDRKWVGIANYLAIFQKKGFLRILFNNTIYAILSVVCQVGLAMVMAACLEEIFMRKFQKFFRTVLFIPSLICPFNGILMTTNKNRIIFFIMNCIFLRLLHLTNYL